MAIYVNTDNPHFLVRYLRRLIREDEISTWILDEENDFTHASAQWRGRAWIHPVIEDERVVFAIIGTRNEPITKLIYSIYMSRFLECLIIHVDRFFVSARISSRPSIKYDVFIE